VRSEYLADSLYEFSIRFKPAWCGYGHLSRTARLVSLQMRIGNAGASSGAERHFASAELLKRRHYRQNARSRILCS